MANLPETPQWEEGIYQIEVSDPVLGGPDGISNRQGKQLASRTLYLKQQVEKGGTDLAKHIAAADPHTQYAPKASPTFTGTPTAPTPANSDNSKKLATTEFVAKALAALAGSAPETLDTLKELADALGNDPNFATTVLNKLAEKLAKDQNGADIPDPALFVKNLQLGEAAKRNVGTGANQLPDMNSFEFQNELNGGYVRFPQNWMLQWKRITVPAASGTTGATASANYLIPFTATVIGSWANVESRTINVAASPFVSASNNDLTSFLATSTYTSSSLGVMVYSIGR